MAQLSTGLELLAATELARVDARLTSSRRIILSILESQARPMTVTDISKHSRTLAQSSLYRNLSILEDAGLVHRIVSDHEFAFFELAEEVLGHHHHLRCSQCGKVIDIDVSAQDEKMLDRISASTGNRNGFTKVHHHLEFVGLCSECA
jgi:Fur family ferric uptake transcriptional regulator